MSAEDFMAFLGFLCCCLVERSKVYRIVRHVVVGPLFCDKVEECVVKEVCILFAGDGKLASGGGGRAYTWTQREFDYTMGYPGEDVCSATSNAVAIAACSELFE